MTIATLFEGALAVVAAVACWVAGVDLAALLTWQWSALVWGSAAAMPMFVLFLLSQRFPAGPLLPIKRLLLEMLGPPLAACRWYDLLVLALLAGVGEELLFRGFLQTWLAGWWGDAGGLIASSILFGLAHLITPTYALLAGLSGVYLGLLLNVSGDNLLVPIVTHGFYDFLAFLVVVREYRSEQANQVRSSPSQAEPTV